MSGLAQRHLGHVDVEPDLALRRHLRRARGEPGRAEVLERDEHAAVEQLEAALEQLLLLERVADLDARPLGGVVLGQLGAGEHRRAADPVAAGARAHQHQQVARRPSAALRISRSAAAMPDAHRVDEAVLLVGGLEVDLAADRGHADRVAVVADALDRAVEQVARARRVELAEAQRVEHRDRPRADREHVAQDAADAGGRALERLDRARVVVRLDLERHRQPVAHVHRAGVLARAHHARAGPRWAAAGAASSSACRRSAPTTSARTPPARAAFGSRPSRSQMPSYSASVRPSSRCGASVLTPRRPARPRAPRATRTARRRRPSR